MRPAKVPARRASIGLALVLLFAGTWVAPARAQSEDQIKAAFLFNFARYVEWPDAAFRGSKSPVRICMAGADDFASIVSQAVGGKSVGDRAVQVVPGIRLEDANGCHILYVGEGITAGSDAVASSVSGGNVFTVADREGFANAGGIANFIRVDNKVRFEINPGAAKRAGLKISSRLLRLAKVVE
ncbi:MAG: YfiR family protein [Myxococcota bacterium]